MVLANMRVNGVRELYVNCPDCGHEFDVDVDDQLGHFAVPSFATNECLAYGNAAHPAASALACTPHPAA